MRMRNKIGVKTRMLTNVARYRIASFIMEGTVMDLLTFLSQKERPDVKCAALDYVLGLSNSQEGRQLIKNTKEIADKTSSLLTDREEIASRKAHLVFVNLSADQDFVDQLLEFVPGFLHYLQEPQWMHSDKLCTILANISRVATGAEHIFHVLNCKDEEAALPTPSLHHLIDMFDRQSSFNSRANFHHLSSVFLNLSQLDSARHSFLDHSKCLLPRLLPYINFSASVIRRGGIIGLCKNLCFEVGEHKWLLGETVDLLPALLLPLAGPDEFEEEEMEKLPLDLQYLPEDKEREPDPDIRKMLLEALLKLCCTKFGRTFLREKQAYLILRELHKWETDHPAKEACERIVHILIADEPEEDNLQDLGVPET